MLSTALGVALGIAIVIAVVYYYKHGQLKTVVANLEADAKSAISGGTAATPAPTKDK